MKILAIETSCDETAIALLEANGGLNAPRFKVLQNEISSQIETHRPFGGVVPFLAKREHLKNLPLVFKRFEGPIDAALIAVTIGPGLEPCLWSGIGFTKEIHQKYFPKSKLIGANHLEGHLYSFLLAQKNIILRNLFPAIALIVSGGHTILLLMRSLENWKKIGETQDDAAGEAFDKVAKMLKLPYPGGPEIEKLALKGSSAAINFPRPMLNQKNYNFSFSGLKTSVLYYLRDNPKTKKVDIAASFQKAAVDTLVFKTLKAAKEFNAKSILLSGGVAANKLLRETLEKGSRKLKIKFIAPPMKFNTDNAVMIGVAAYINYFKKKKFKITAQPNLGI